jgi:hypothetical protein
MWIPKEMSVTVDKLKKGGWVRRIAVRQLPRMFKAERRGLNKVQEIRATLDYLGLQTVPDFESAWIDSLIRGFYLLLNFSPGLALWANVVPRLRRSGTRKSDPALGMNQACPW